MGFYTTDQVDLNTVYYKNLVPSVERYNQYDFYPFKEMLSSDIDESYVRYPITKITFSALGEAEVPSSDKLTWARFKGTTSKTGAAFGYTFDFLKDASSDMIDRTQAAIYDADRLQIQNLILAACLDGSTVRGFWNAAYDRETADPLAYGELCAPPAFGQNTFGSLHNHYEALGTTTPALTQFTNAKQHIAEHGHGGPYVCWINSAEVERLENLATWTSTYTANPIIDRVAIEGFSGSMLGINFYQTEAIPAGYVLIVSLGKGTYDQPVKFIQASNPTFRGLIYKAGTTDADYPIVDSYFLRWANTKVWARGAGYVMWLNSSTTYTTPTLEG